MEKIEYTCDRCGKEMPIEQSWKLRLERVFMKVGARISNLERSLDGMSKDLCADCVSNLMKWMKDLEARNK